MAVDPLAYRQQQLARADWLRTQIVLALQIIVTDSGRYPEITLSPGLWSASWRHWDRTRRRYRAALEITEVGSQHRFALLLDANIGSLSQLEQAWAQLEPLMQTVLQKQVPLVAAEDGERAVSPTTPRRRRGTPPRRIAGLDEVETQQQCREVAQLAIGGLTSAQLAERYRVDPSTIDRWIAWDREGW